MGWIVVIIIGIILFYIFFSNRSSRKHNVKSRPAEKIPTINPPAKRRITYAKPPTSAKDAETKRLLQQAYQNHNRITMTYETGNPVPREPAIKTRKVDLYGVGDDYVDAFCYYRNELRTFKISRIVSIHTSTEQYKIPSNYSESDWVKYGWGEIDFSSAGED